MLCGQVRFVLDPPTDLLLKYSRWVGGTFGSATRHKRTNGAITTTASAASTRPTCHTGGESLTVPCPPRRARPAMAIAVGHACKIAASACRTSCRLLGKRSVWPHRRRHLIAGTTSSPAPPQHPTYLLRSSCYTTHRLWRDQVGQREDAQDCQLRQVLDHAR